ncbi:MAG TPA: hypothetical protein VGI33_07420, partial [Paenibacillus sp.]
LRKHMPWSPNFNRYASLIQKFGDHSDWRNDPFAERPRKTLTFSHKTKRQSLAMLNDFWDSPFYWRIEDIEVLSRSNYFYTLYQCISNFFGPLQL